MFHFLFALLRQLAGLAGVGLMLLNAVAWINLLADLDLVLGASWLVGVLSLSACLGWLGGWALAQRVFPPARRKRLSPRAWLGVAALVGLALVFQGPLLAALDDPLLLTQPPQVSEVIWILGISSERYPYGVALFEQGYGKQLVMSLQTHSAPVLFRSQTVKTNVDAIRAYAERHGVAAEAMTFLQAENTYQEALLARDYFKSHHITSALIVSSPTHMRRAAMIFQHVVGDGVKLTFNAVPIGQSDYQSAWWTDSYSLGRVIYEYLSLVYYAVAYLMF